MRPQAPTTATFPHTDLSVVLAAYDEAGTIAAVLDDLQTVLPGAEIVVVDDGSADDTAARATRPGVRVERHDRNRGKGAAIRTGLGLATRPVTVLMDVDGQDLAAEIPLLLAPLERGADLVIGSKFIGTRRAGAITHVNALGNLGLSGIIDVLFGARLTDTQSGFKAGWTAKLRRLGLTADQYDIEAQMVARALKQGLRVVEVPVTRAPRQAGESKLSPLRHGARILARIVLERARA